MLEISDIVNMELCKIGLRYATNQMPILIKSLFGSQIKQHGYNNRFKNAPKVLKHKGHIFNKSFLARSPILFRNLPLKCKRSKTVKIFTKNYKQMVFNRN